MELLPEREYHPSGTNGILSCAEQFICFTIELPWRDNRKLISCIPEGRYPLALRYSDRHHWHLVAFLTTVSVALVTILFIVLNAAANDNRKR